MIGAIVPPTAARNKILLSKFRDVFEPAIVAMGFQLSQIEISDGDLSVRSSIVRGMVGCPCGGFEYFSIYLDPYESFADSTVCAALHAVDTFRQHVLDDVNTGKLPPAWGETLRQAQFTTRATG